MLTPTIALSKIPIGLRNPLISEYKQIVCSFMDGKWTASELSGGKFAEIVYTILEGYASGNYKSKPKKPRNFVDSCRKLENNTNIPRSFQILIPRLLPAIYEIRNNRNVGHVGGDVNPDLMDANIVISATSWIMAELVRVFHNTTTDEAQKLIDSLTEKKIPLVWKSGKIRRLLNPKIKLKDQILIFLLSSNAKIKSNNLFQWIEYKDRGHFNRILKKLHKERLIEFYQEIGEVELLPPGSKEATTLINKLKEKGNS